MTPPKPNTTNIKAQPEADEQLRDLTIMVRPTVFINDTRTTEQKLADLTDDNLLDGMEHSFADFRRETDPVGVMSDNWLWNRWIRS